jgi:hypothetical protein
MGRRYDQTVNRFFDPMRRSEAARSILGSRLLTWNWSDIAVGIGSFALTFFGTLAIAVYVLVQLPADYFENHTGRRLFSNWPKSLRWSGILFKNLLGILIIAVGIVLSLPGVPGQGVLTIVMGMMLLDLPGSRVLLLRLVRIPRVFAGINILRARYGKAPLTLRNL